MFTRTRPDLQHNKDKEKIIKAKRAQLNRRFFITSQENRIVSSEYSSHNFEQLTLVKPEFWGQHVNKKGSQ